MRDSRTWAVAKVAVLATIFIGLFFIYLPVWAGIFQLTADFRGWRALRLLGIAPLAVGAFVGLRCIFDFVWTGHGTPAPIAPPRHLVVTGFYRYVRNPMYVGFGAALVSAWIVFGAMRWLVLIIAVVLAGGIHAFVRLYEEPVLRRTFGADYEEFCSNVPRWLPLRHAWTPEHARIAKGRIIASL